MNKPITMTSSIIQHDIIDVDRSLVQTGSINQNIKLNNKVNKESGVKRQREQVDKNKRKRQKPLEQHKKKLTARRITKDDEIETIDFIPGKKTSQFFIQSNYIPRTLLFYNQRRLSILPTFPPVIFNNSPQLLLANVSINELSSVQLARREHGKYQSSFKVLNPDPITPSLMIKFYNKMFGSILERFKMNLLHYFVWHVQLTHIPQPPPGYKFSKRQIKTQVEFFKKNLINERLVDDIYVYNAKIIAVMPPNTSDLFRRIVHLLFVTHTETKLNALGHIFTNTDAVNIRNGIWCANLIRRTIVPT
ncbi:unnamed protein product [Rotaria sordida]|uniref:Uncharacterized protein n=1 Tax=Rotaria sordida TaxID=392033 RepID=A0A815G4B9_9BILA|nr:unnamed protein product [Rotaria sordida]CAF1353754.1 unnamed protein product [Rotaria sordida]CAF3575605.1 unnamed protein product [Rotaria sordida]CAF3809191.1 unnamed protein product [Rotaria sordida]